jgi:DNA-binding NarL/FixJ family response regulator
MIVEDHPTTRAGLLAIIDAQPDLQVCRAAESPQEALAFLGSSQADLLITDLSMPGRGGLAFVRDVHEALPSLQILVLSMHDEMLYAERCLKAGARGYLMKNVGLDRLMAALRVLLTGASYVSPRVTARLVDALSGRRPRGSSSPIEALSEREFEVFCLFGHGNGTKETACAMGISPKTVEVYRGHLKRKLQLKDAVTLMHHAVRWIESGEFSFQAEPHAAQAA